ncbi:MAG: hypothetical protein ACRDIX_07230 [Actinomycetota bacterium]
MKIDPDKPMVALNVDRGCPECFAPVRFLRTDSDHHGWYEIWECTAAEQNVGHEVCEDPRCSRTMDQRAIRTGPCSNPSHVARVGRYIVRESHYRRAFQRRGASDRRRARRAAGSSSTATVHGEGNAS